MHYVRNQSGLNLEFPENFKRQTKRSLCFSNIPLILGMAARGNQATLFGWVLQETGGRKAELGEHSVAANCNEF